jgi:hypothetical protein
VFCNGITKLETPGEIVGMELEPSDVDPRKLSGDVQTSGLLQPKQNRWKNNTIVDSTLQYPIQIYNNKMIYTLE